MGAEAEKIVIASVAGAKFLKISKTFELHCGSLDGASYRLRLPLDALHALLDAAESAEAKGHLTEADFTNDSSGIVPTAVTVHPVERSGVMMTFELRTGSKGLFQLMSQAPDETKLKAGHQIAHAIGLLTAGSKN